MKSYSNRMLAAGFLLFAGAVSGTAGDYKAGDLSIASPWARPTQAANGAAYFTVTNAGKGEDTLLSAQSPVAGTVEVHEHIKDGDVMRMRPVQGGVKVPAGATVPFKPGGYHVMLINLKQKLEVGQAFPLTLNFAKAGAVNVEVKVDTKANPSH